MATYRTELDLPRLSAQARQRFIECISGRGVPRPLWSQAAPPDESWKFLLPGGAVLLLVMALVGGDKVQGWPLIIGWLLAAVALAAGVMGWQRGKKSAARLGFPPGTYLFASDLIDARDGVCTLYDLDQLTELRPKTVHHGTATDSELDFVFGREVVAIAVPGKQTAQITINKFWPAREALMTAASAGEWNDVAALDPLYEPRYMGGWEQVRRPSTAPAPARTTIDAKAGKGPLGMHPAVLRLAVIVGIVAAPILWLGGNYVRESLAFSRAKSRDTVAIWREYLKRDQPPHYVEAKQQLLPRAALRDAKKAGNAAAIRDFLARYGDTPVAAEGKTALHDKYEQAIAQVKAEAGASVREEMAELLRWLDQHQADTLEVRFGSSSAAAMAALDEFIEMIAEEKQIRAPIAPIGPSLAPEIVTRREDELVDAVKAGLADVIPPDLVHVAKGGVFSGMVAGLDRPALTVTCYATPNPQLIPDTETRKLYLRLSFAVEFNLFVPGKPPYTSAFEVAFVDKVPKTRGKDNLYDGMLAYAFEEAQQRIAKDLFPKHPPARKLALMEMPDAEPRTSGRPMATATGFCISPDGYIATADHFTSGLKSYKVITKDGPIEARLVQADPEHDIAVLKVSAPLPSALAVRPSETIKLGESIATIGFPQTQLQGREPKIGKGEIASLSGMRDDPGMFQVSVPLQPGNSGGPLLDLNGNVVGVVVMVLRESQQVNYAVKSQHLAALCRRIPELRNLAAATNGTPPAFEDMIARVRPATFLLEGYR
jgi:S1-C subfamily serine protease